MYFKLNGTEYSCAEGTTWEQVLKEHALASEKILAVLADGHTCHLRETVKEYTRAELITLSCENGQRIMERSLQLLLLTAAQRVNPGTRLRFEHSFGNGLYLIDMDGPLKEETVVAIREEMRRLAELNIRIDCRMVSPDEACKITGQARRLREEEKQCRLYSVAGGPEDYFYGCMTPDTGCLRVFDLVPCYGGALLLPPDPKDPDRPFAYEKLPKLMQVYRETAEWHRILGVENVSDLNALTKGGDMRGFIRVCEALMEHKLAEVAESFKKSGARVLLIAGPSSSGKTTFAHRLMIALRVLGLRPVKVSLDDYYLNRDLMPRDEDGSIDFERIDTLDIDLIGDHLVRLLRGEEVQIPTYDFVTGMRTQETHPFSVEAGQPIVIEGIHALNDKLTEAVPRSEKFKVYISALTMLNLDDHNRIRSADVRLLRRIVRDSRDRGTAPDGTLAMWKSVRRGEERYIYPFSEDADATVNSTLSYELAFISKIAYQALCEVRPESPQYAAARQLQKLLSHVLPADCEDEIPGNSILREFLGGCCFYRK